MQVWDHAELLEPRSRPKTNIRWFGLQHRWSNKFKHRKYLYAFIINNFAVCDVQGDICRRILHRSCVRKIFSNFDMCFPIWLILCFKGYPIALKMQAILLRFQDGDPSRKGFIIKKKRLPTLMRKGHGYVGNPCSTMIYIYIRHGTDSNFAFCWIR